VTLFDTRDDPARNSRGGRQVILTPALPKSERLDATSKQYWIHGRRMNPASSPAITWGNSGANNPGASVTLAASVPSKPAT
jgi:hypothetical protein